MHKLLTCSGGGGGGPSRPSGRLLLRSPPTSD